MEEDYRADPVLIVRPRWELENWALHLLDEPIGEERDPGAQKRVGDRARTAARTLADACRAGTPLPDPPPSLATACAEWQSFRTRYDL